jgi:DNA/RNA endonuclease YhcR with UshA esterase domain
MRAAATVLALFPILAPADAPEDKPLSPVEARKRINERVTVEMLVRASKNRLEKHKEIYLDSELNFRDRRNLAVVLSAAGAAKFKAAGVEEPAGYFKGKTIRATGTVTVHDGVPRIVVDDPRQIRLVPRKGR